MCFTTAGRQRLLTVQKLFGVLAQVSLIFCWLFAFAFEFVILYDALGFVLLRVFNKNLVCTVGCFLVEVFKGW